MSESRRTAPAPPNQEPTPAATIMVVRQCAGDAPGVEVFLMKRSATGDFASLYVFPGGKVDAQDGENQWLDNASRSVKLANQKLSVSQGGLDYYLAAVRECFEETGLLLAKDQYYSCRDPEIDDLRQQLLANKISFAQLCQKLSCQPDVDSAHYMAHWITPTGAWRRYDTRFFLMVVPREIPMDHDDWELVDSVWIKPEQALLDAQQGRKEMIEPTIKNLEAIAGYSGIQDLLVAAEQLKDIPCIVPGVDRDDSSPAAAKGHSNNG